MGWGFCENKSRWNMVRLALLEQEIETLRQELIEVAMKKGFTDFEVISINRKIHRRFTEYDRLLRMNNQPMIEVGQAFSCVT